jgi:hypothetical protein
MPMLLLKSFAGTRLKKLALDVVCSVRNKLERLLLEHNEGTLLVSPTNIELGCTFLSLTKHSSLLQRGTKRFIGLCLARTQ